MRAAHQVPQDDLSVNGQRCTYSDRFRGQDVVLHGTIVAKRWERSLGSDVYRVRPDLVEGMESLTTYAASVRKSRMISIGEA